MRGNNEWSYTRVQVIAWKSFLMGINWITQTVLITKIFNQLLPKDIYIKKCNWQSHDNFTLCTHKKKM